MKFAFPCCVVVVLAALALATVRFVNVKRVSRRPPPAFDWSSSPSAIPPGVRVDGYRRPAFKTLVPGAQMYFEKVSDIWWSFKDTKSSPSYMVHALTFREAGLPKSWIRLLEYKHVRGQTADYTAVSISGHDEITWARDIPVGDSGGEMRCGTAGNVDIDCETSHASPMVVEYLHQWMRRNTEECVAIMDWHSL